MKNPNMLFKKSKKDYGREYSQHLLEQYKLYIESAEKISDRRQQSNNYFITVNTILISVLGVSKQIGAQDLFNWIGYSVCVLGVIVCVVFWFLIRAYKQLNSKKFAVIHEIEKELPVAVYNYEWELLDKGRSWKTYFPFSHIEMIMPWVFALVYIILSVVLFGCSYK